VSRVEELIALQLGPTRAPTMIRASDRRNVTPALSEFGTGGAGDEDARDTGAIRGSFA
jgi:hypothetical protein